MKSTICEICGRSITNPNLKRHLESHKNGKIKKNTYKLDHDDLFCKFCGKACHNKNSLVQHEIRCRENKNRIAIAHGSSPIGRKGHTAWNKGLTKYTDERVRRYGESCSRTQRGRKGKPHAPESIDKMMKSYALTIHSRKTQGRYKYKYGTINGISCDSGYELAFVAYFLYHNKDIKRNIESFDYFFEGKKHKYYPDFISDGVYYEIKGVFYDMDYAKISQFPKDKKLVVIGNKDIKKYINFCKETYGERYEETLYDKRYPCWTDRLPPD